MVMNDLRAHFRPEFLNRLDETIMFKPLTKDNIYDIIDLLVADVNKRLADREIQIELTEEAKSRQCGDGGVLCGLWELAEAEKIGFEIDFSKLALKQETVEICEFFQLNPYLLTSAGSYLELTEHGEETLESLKNAGVPAVRIGFVKEQNARTLVNGEETRYLDRPAPDELSRWWKERKESEE